MGAGAGQEVGLGAGRDDAAVADDDEVVGDDLDLVQQVRGQQHGGATVGVAAQQVSHPPDAGRVEAVRGLVEDEHLGVAEESVGEPEALPHPQGVVPQPSPGLVLAEADEVEHLLDAAGGQPHGASGDAQHLPAGAAGVLGGGVEEDADLHARVGQVPEPSAQDVRGAVVGWGESDQDPQGGRLPGTVGSQEPGDASGRAVKVTSSTAVKVP